MSEHPRAANDAGLLPWSCMLLAFGASAGHGAFLLFQVLRLGPPGFHGLRSGAIALIVLWFTASIPLACLTLLLRGRVRRWRLRGVVATLVVLATLLAFAGYFYAIVSTASAFDV